MNAEQLNGLLSHIATAYAGNGIPKRFTQLQSALDSVANNSNDGTAQTNYRTTLQNLSEALSIAALNNFSIREYKLIEELDLKSLIGEELKQEIARIVSQAQLTPRLAHDEIVKLRDETNKRLELLQRVSSGLAELNIGKGDPQPGEAELGLFVPRHGENLSLDQLLEEGTDLNRLIALSYEIVEGRPHSPEVSFLVSCDYGFLVLVAPVVLKFTMECIEKALDLTIKYAAAAKAIRDLRDHGADEDEVESILAKRKAKQEADLEGIVRKAVLDRSNADDGTKNEQIVRLTKLITSFVEKRQDRGNYVDVRVMIEPAMENSDGTDDETRQLASRVATQQQLAAIAHRVHALEQETSLRVATIAAPANKVDD